MSVSGAKGMLYDAMKDLRVRFDSIKSQWADQARHHFEKEEIETLEPRILAAIKALDGVTEIIQRVQRECGDDSDTYF